VNLAGVDLAWQSERNPSSIAYGSLNHDVLMLNAVDPAVYGIDEVLGRLSAIDDLVGIAIDAPLMINNESGQRPCESAIGKTYGSRGASCHTSNTKRFPDAKSVYLSGQLSDREYTHLGKDRWQIECYPHPAIIEMFGMPERLKYKKGRVADKRAGQKQLASLLRRLEESPVLPLRFDGYTQILDEVYIDSIGGQALKSNEDALDAIVCLYIAGLYACKAKGEVFGDGEAGYVWVPQVCCL